MFQTIEIISFAGISAIVVLAALYFWSWSRERYRFVVCAIAAFLGFSAWNLVQSGTGTDQTLNIDWPILPLSWADVRSGVMTFVFVTLALGLLFDRKQAASRVIVEALIAGTLAPLVDVFVL